MADPAVRPQFVGIAGGSGSGKTTITNALMGTLGDRGVLLQHDWYYRDQAGVPEAERAGVNFDHPEAQETELLAAHLQRLRAGETIEAPQYDFTTHTRTAQTLRIAPRPFIVVEGINTLANPGLCALFDLTVFVDTPPDIRFIRRLQRDVVERGRTVTSIVEQYLGQVRPMHLRHVEPCQLKADLVLSGEAELSESVERILTCLGIEVSAR